MSIQKIHQNIYDTIIIEKFGGDEDRISGIQGFKFKFEHRGDAAELFSILREYRNGNIVYSIGGDEVLMAVDYFQGIINELSPTMENINSKNAEFHIISELMKSPNIVDIEVPRSLLLLMPKAGKKLIQSEKTEAELKAANKRLEAEAKLLREALLQGGGEAADSPAAQEAVPVDGGGVGIFSPRTERLSEAILQGGGKAADSPTAQEAGPVDGGGEGVLSPAKRAKYTEK